VKYLKKILPILVIVSLILYGFGANALPNTKSKSSLNSYYTDNYDMMIIAPESFSDTLQPLINHKNSVGIQTFLKTNEEIYDEYTGRDEAEQIKNAIKNSFDEYNIQYVLLIGNFKQIPVRYCYNYDDYKTLDICFISDLYYADLYDSIGFISNWDGNENGIFGEWNGKEAQDKNISLTPEICIGRLPCNNKDEVKIIINKIINYEEKTYGSEWFNNFVVAGGDTYSPARGYNDEIFSKNEGEVNTQEAIQIMKNFKSIKLWASNNKLTTLNLIIAINNGCGFLYLSGHGNPNTWVTHPINSSESIGRISNFLIFLLKNEYKLPICIVGGCHNSQFDVHFLNILKDPYYYYTWIHSCWSWKLASSIRGGSIATIGCTGLGWSGKEFGGGGNDWLNIHFFEEYANGTIILGSIWKNTLNNYLELFPINWETPNGETSSIDAKTVQEWVLIGDPSLRIGGYP
jgi:hypothetical protein